MVGDLRIHTAYEVLGHDVDSSKVAEKREEK